MQHLRTRLADFPLHAGWEPPGPADELGRARSAATTLWPGMRVLPRAGWTEEARAVFVQVVDTTPRRFRRRQVLAYPTAVEAVVAFAGVQACLLGLPVSQPAPGGQTGLLATTEHDLPGSQELRVLRWCRRGDREVAGVTAALFHRAGRGLLVSVENSDAVGHEAAAAASVADREGLAPALAALPLL